MWIESKNMKRECYPSLDMDVRIEFYDISPHSRERRTLGEVSFQIILNVAQSETNT